MPKTSCKKLLGFGIALVVLFTIGICLKTYFKTPTESPVDLIIQANGEVTDQIVELLGWTGVRIAHDSVPIDPRWPETLLTLQSRSLEEIAPVVNGDANPRISWRQKPKPLEDKKQIERWEMDADLTPDQIKNVTDIILNKLELKKEVLPKDKAYAGTLFLSASLSTVRQRLAFLNALIESKNPQLGKIYVLMGERSLSEAAGETKENMFNARNDIVSFVSGWSPPHSIPTDEGDMMKLVFDQSRHPSLKNEDIQFVYAPRRKGEVRATTASTLAKWLEEVNPPAETYLAISNQPYVLYQELVILRCLLEANRPDIHVEAVGSKMTEPAYARTESQEAASLLDYLNRIIYELARIKKLEQKYGMSLKELVYRASMPN